MGRTCRDNRPAASKSGTGPLTAISGKHTEQNVSMHTVYEQDIFTNNTSGKQNSKDEDSLQGYRIRGARLNF